MLCDQHLWKGRERGRAEQREKLNCDVVSVNASAKFMEVLKTELILKLSQVGMRGHVFITVPLSHPTNIQCWKGA